MAQAPEQSVDAGTGQVLHGTKSRAKSAFEIELEKIKSRVLDDDQQQAQKQEAAKKSADDDFNEFDYSYIPDELKDLICGPAATGSVDVTAEIDKVMGKTKHKDTLQGKAKKDPMEKKKRVRIGDDEEEDEDEGEDEDEDEYSDYSDDDIDDIDEEEVEVSSEFTESADEFPLDEYDSDLEESDEEDRKNRRYLLGTHSFLDLRDPGLADALIPKAEETSKAEDETPKSQKKQDKQRYLDICKELGVQPIKKFIQQMRTDTVDLNRYFLNADDIIAICRMMENNTRVKYLNLSGNIAGLEGGLAIAKMIENNYTLTHLNISAMGLLPAFKKICDAVALNITLESLDISRNELGDKEMTGVSNFLKETGTLRELYMSRNHIRDQGAARIGMGLKENQSLELLDLAVNEMKGEKPSWQLFQSIGDHPAMKHLDLYNNTFKDQMAKGVSRVFNNNKQMEYMDTSFNIFDNPGAGTMAKGFRKAEAMKNFIAGPNEWRQDGAANLLHPFAWQKFQAPMEVIDFGWLFDVYNQFLKAEEKALKAHPDLKIIRGNAFGQWVAKDPDAKALVIKRARIVCENFATPLNMLIDELRTEPKKMSQKDFKKFIKSCNLYKDKTLTEAFIKVFALTPFEVNCEDIIATYDRVFPNKATLMRAESIFKGSDATSKLLTVKDFKRERDTSVMMMKW